MARQLMQPSGLFGRYVMGRLLNRSTSHHCSIVREELAVRPEDRVLEVGFGGASLLSLLCQDASRGFVAGAEVSDEMLAAASKRLRSQVASGQLALSRASVQSLPYADAEFDKACSVNTTYFWTDLDRGLAELSRVIRRGGRLVLGFVSPEDIVKAGLDRYGFSYHSPEELNAALVLAGFEPKGLRSGSDSRGTFYVVTAERVC
jgi:ubiquinone/menaquinone biosynthesis C-methylase UbiE